jgi:hypothetical protein
MRGEQSPAFSPDRLREADGRLLELLPEQAEYGERQLWLARVFGPSSLFSSLSVYSGRRVSSVGKSGSLA